MSDLMARPVEEAGPKKKAKDKMLLSLNVQELDDGTFVCEKRYGNDWDNTKKTSHQTVRDLMDYLEDYIEDEE